MRPSSSPSSGAPGAGLGPGTWLCPSLSSPGPCSFVPSPSRRLQVRITAFSPAPLQVGCRRPVTMATKLGHFLWAWGSAGDGKADHPCRTCAFRSGRVAVQAMCAHAGVELCVLLRGRGLLWVCLQARGPGECVPSWACSRRDRPACVCAHVVRGWPQAQACGFHAHRARAVGSESRLPHAGCRDLIQVPARCLTCCVTRCLGAFPLWTPFSLLYTDFHPDLRPVQRVCGPWGLGF